MPLTLVKLTLLASVLAFDPVASAAISRTAPLSMSPRHNNANANRWRALHISSSRCLPAMQEALLIRGGDVDDASAAARNPLFPTTESFLIKAAGAFDPKDIVAKAACAFFMGQSTTAWLAPHRTCLKYGLSTSTLNVACNRKLATAYLGSVTTMYGMLFQKCSTSTAIGSAAVCWMAEQLKARLLYEAEDTGRPIWEEYLVGAAATLVAYATLLDVRFAPLASKVGSGLLLVNGLAFFVAPAEVCQLWQVPVQKTVVPANPKNRAQQQAMKQQVKEYNESIFLHRYMGVALVFSGILHTVLAWGGTIEEAIGCAFAFLFCVNCWSFLKTSDFKRLARSSLVVSSTFDWKKRLSKLFFPVFNFVVTLTLLVGNNDNHHGQLGSGVQ